MQILHELKMAVPFHPASRIPLVSETESREMGV